MTDHTDTDDEGIAYETDFSEYTEEESDDDEGVEVEDDQRDDP